MRTSPLTSCDIDTIAENGAIKRGGIGAALAAAARCSHGRVQVLLCRPVYCGRPFPTSFWLVCPHMMRAAAAAEGRGGVPALEAALLDRASAALAYDELHARIRLELLSEAQRRYLRAHRPAFYDALARTGIGGSAHREGPPRVKCLHLHAASLRALGAHPAARELEDLLGPMECRGH